MITCAVLSTNIVGSVKVYFVNIIDVTSIHVLSLGSRFVPGRLILEETTEFREVFAFLYPTFPFFVLRFIFTIPIYYKIRIYYVLHYRLRKQSNFYELGTCTFGEFRIHVHVGVKSFYHNMSILYQIRTYQMACLSTTANKDRQKETQRRRRGVIERQMIDDSGRISQIYV